MTTVVYLENALSPQNRRVQRLSGQSVRDLAPEWQTPFVCFCDGRPVLRAEWELVPEDDQSLAFIDVRLLPQGGGGGGSDPMRLILSLAVITFAPQLAQSLVFGDGIMAAATLGSTGLAVFNAGAMFAGMALVNALLPAPKLPTPQQAASLAAPSPTYSLQAQGNTARLDAAIPEHFGRLQAYPDFAAQPYSEFSGGDQYLYQLLAIGRGQYDIEAIRIEDTPIASFDDITYEVVPPSTPVTLFPVNVVTSTEATGQDLPCFTGTYSQSGTTTLTVTSVAHGLSTGNSVYLDFTSGTATDGTFTITVTGVDTFTITTTSATTSGNVTISKWVGGFIASASGTTANYLGIDVVMARGLYSVDAGTGVLSTVSIGLVAEARTVDAAGAPLTSFTTLVSPTYSAATTTPQRFSERQSVTAARYEVRVRRSTAKNTATTVGNEIAWAGLRAYLNDSRTFGDVTLIAMRMKASSNLSLQASRKVNVICTRKLPIWNGSVWSANTATRSIAWATAYACKQVGMTDAQIDLAGLISLDNTWTARGDYFDGRFDSFLSFWEAITQIAKAGRAKPFLQGGIMRLMRDQAATIPVAMFSQRNIVRGSFTIDYLMPTADTADAVDIKYFDSSTWASATVRAKLSGSTASVPAKVNLFGVVGRDQAYREGMYMAASNRYRRRLIKFSTEMEGFIPSFGDLIAIQHDMPAWGQGGEVTAWNSATKTLTLTENMVFTTGTHYVALRKRDGSMDGPFVATAGGSANQLVLVTAPSFTPYTGGSEERTHIMFGPGQAYTQLARVLAAKPKSLTMVDIEAINEDSNVHTADSGVTTPSLVVSALAGYTNAPVVLGLTARSMTGAPEKMLLSWQPSAWADYYLIEQSADGVKWTRTGETGTANYTATALYGAATIVRVAAVGIARGPWVQVVYGSSADYMWTTDSALMWNASSATVMWRY